MQIEFLYFDGCPGERAAYRLLQEVLEQEGAEADVTRLAVPGPEAVEEYRFPGSPTIRVNGVDLEGAEAEARGYAWACRRYAESEPGESDRVPAAELIRRRLRGAATGNGS